MRRRLHIPAMVVVALAVVSHAAAAQATPTIKTTVTPQRGELTLAPGQRANDTLTVKVEFLNNACTSGSNVTISLVFEKGFPSWAGASPEPQNLKFDWPGETKKSNLELFPADDAPRGQNVTYRILPQLHSPPTGACQPGVEVASTPAVVKLTITPATLSIGATNSKKSSPGFEGLAALGALGCLLLRRRP